MARATIGRTPAGPAARATETAGDGWPHPARWYEVALGGLCLALALGLLGAVWLLARPLGLLVAAVALAAAFAPLVGWLGRFMPRVRAILLVYAVILLVAGVTGWIILPGLVGQGRQLVEHAPRLIESGQALLERWTPLTRWDALDALRPQASRVAEMLVGLPINLASAVMEVLIVFVTSIYWLIAWPGIFRFVLSLFPPERHDGIRAMLDEVGTSMGGYIRGSAINAAIVGVLVYLGVLLIGLDYPLVFALLAALGEFVPYVGPFLAAVPAVAAALIVSPTTALLVIGFYSVMQLLENHFLVPAIMRRQTEIPPVLVLVALLAGGSIGGVLGALVAIPLAGALRVLIRDVVAPAVRRWTGAAAPVKDQHGPSRVA